MCGCGFLILLIINFNLLSCGKITTGDNSTLQLVHVLFRHGDRTTATITLYPKDPYINETYYPYGRGELTNKGKLREYNLGKSLRTRYDEFLGKIYTPDILEAISSNTNRTKMSLQLVLAGLFPPVESQILETGLNWQPIPYTSLPNKEDTIFFGIFCPNFKKFYNEVVISPKMLKEFQKHNEIFDYLSENTGVNVTTYWDVIFIYLCLKTEDEYGLTLPEWTKKVYPEQLKELAVKSYNLLTATTELKRLTSGYLLKKIIEDSNGKINGKLVPNTRKIFLYSGHEFNIAHLLETLGVFDKPQIPPYGSYILFELHRINDIYGFKIFYQDYSTSEPHILKLPACDEFCPLSQFVLLMEEYLPEKNSCKPS